jgi:uncharacterized protein YraI
MLSILWQSSKKITANVALAASVLISGVAFGADGSTEIVTVSTLNMRSAPNQKAAVVGALPRGTKVTVLTKSDDWVEVDGLKGQWVSVKAASDGKTGWVLNRFLAAEYTYLNGDTNMIAWSTSGLPAAHPTGCEVVLYQVDQKKQTRIAVTTETCGPFGFSQDLKYLAVDDGTYVYGQVHIYRMQDKKLLRSISYYPRQIRWKENTLEFNEVLCDDSGFLMFETLLFNNGKIKRTGKIGAEGARSADTQCGAHQAVLLKHF